MSKRQLICVIKQSDARLGQACIAPILDGGKAFGGRQMAVAVWPQKELHSRTPVMMLVHGWGGLIALKLKQLLWTDDQVSACPDDEPAPLGVLNRLVHEDAVRLILISRCQATLTASRG